MLGQDQSADVIKLMVRCRITHESNEHQLSPKSDTLSSVAPMENLAKARVPRITSVSAILHR